jgi:hypothetical protein
LALLMQHLQVAAVQPKAAPPPPAPPAAAGGHVAAGGGQASDESSDSEEAVEDQLVRFLNEPRSTDDSLSVYQRLAASAYLGRVVAPDSMLWASVKPTACPGKLTVPLSAWEDLIKFNLVFYRAFVHAAINQQDASDALLIAGQFFVGLSDFVHRTLEDTMLASSHVNPANIMRERYNVLRPMSEDAVTTRLAQLQSIATINFYQQQQQQQQQQRGHGGGGTGNGGGSGHGNKGRVNRNRDSSVARNGSRSGRGSNSSSRGGHAPAAGDGGATAL